MQVLVYRVVHGTLETDYIGSGVKNLEEKNFR